MKAVDRQPAAWNCLPPERTAAPMSAAALQSLAKIPRLSAIRAFHGIGRAIIDRTGYAPSVTVGRGAH